MRKQRLVEVPFGECAASSFLKDKEPGLPMQDNRRKNPNCYE
jgi:hypothetical protein